MRRLRWGLVFLLGFGSAQGLAQDAAQDELGFSDAPIAAPAPAPSTDSASTGAAAPAASVRLSGSAALESAVRLERPDARWGKLRQVLGLRLEHNHLIGQEGASFQAVASGRGEADFAYLMNPEKYDDPTMELYGSRLIVGETYLRVATSHVELAFGEQIVNLGQGEVLSVLDVVNPRDLREPLFQDAAALRLPVLMSRLGVTLDRLSAVLLAVHEPYFGLLPPPTGEFSPFRKLLLDIPTLGSVLTERELRYQHEPGRAPTQIDATQFHLRLAYSGSNVDLSLHASSLLDPLGIPALPNAEAWAREDIDLPVYHPRYGLIGQSGAASMGAFVLRWELAAELKRPYLLAPLDTTLPEWSSERMNTLGGMLGLTYIPSARANLALEVLQTGVLDNPERRTPKEAELLFPVEATQLALRSDTRFLRDRAQLTLLVLCIGVLDFNALAARAELAYELFDAVRASLGVVTYQPSSEFGVFYGFNRNDRIYANVRWDFAAN